MDSKEKRREITILIDNIKKHSDRLSENPTIPLLELSVILSKITRLHEKTVILKYLLAKEQNYEEEEFGSIDIYEEEKRIEKELKLTREKIAKEEKKVGEKGAETQEQGQNSTGENELHATLEEKVKDDPVGLEDQIDLEKIEKEELSSKPDLNEQYSEEEDPSLSEQLKKQPIADLLTAIGLNERYLYANELFGGDIEDFRKVIRTLNDFESREEATKYFSEQLRPSYGWEQDNEMAKALYLLVERRFQ